jgi:hypothetical protein
MKTNTIPILMHKMRITYQVSAVMVKTRDSHSKCQGFSKGAINNSLITLNILEFSTYWLQNNTSAQPLILSSCHMVTLGERKGRAEKAE